MSQCFSWHNLRYIKKTAQASFHLSKVFNTNIIVFLRKSIYAHNRDALLPSRRHYQQAYV